MNYEEEAYFYHTIMDFAQLAKTYGDRTFSELEYVCPEVFDLLKAYLCDVELNSLEE